MSRNHFPAIIIEPFLFAHRYYASRLASGAITVSEEGDAFFSLVLHSKKTTQKHALFRLGRACARSVYAGVLS